MLSRCPEARDSARMATLQIFRDGTASIQTPKSGAMVARNATGSYRIHGNEVWITWTKRGHPPEQQLFTFNPDELTLLDPGYTTSVFKKKVD